MRHKSSAFALVFATLATGTARADVFPPPKLDGAIIKTPIATFTAPLARWDNMKETVTCEVTADQAGKIELGSHSDTVIDANGTTETYERHGNRQTLMMTFGLTERVDVIIDGKLVGESVCAPNGCVSVAPTLTKQLTNRKAYNAVKACWLELYHRGATGLQTMRPTPHIVIGAVPGTWGPHA